MKIGKDKDHMEGDRYTKARLEGFEVGLSLAAAIQDAGGSVRTVLAKTMENMTLSEFVASVAAQNGIRFCYEIKQKDKHLRETK